MIRNLLRRPTSTLVVIITIGAGLSAMGVVAALFTAVLFPSNPYRDVNRLVTLWASPAPGAVIRADHLTPQRTDAWLAAPPRSFERIAAVGSSSAVLRHGDGARRVALAVVTGSFSPMLGAPAQLGRMLTAADSAAGAEPTVVVSDRAWRAYFHADPDIVGKVVRLDGNVYTVAGVAHPAMDYPRGSDIWVPRVHVPQEHQPVAWMLLGRMREGTKFTAARAEVIARAQAEHQADSTSNAGQGVTAVEFTSVERGFGQGIFPLIGICLTALYLIAVLNLGILLLLQVSARTSELAIRAALGAGNWGAVRPLAVEMALQFGIGCVVALVSAFTAMRVIRDRFLFDLAPLTGRAELVVLLAIVMLAIATAAILIPVVLRNAASVDLFGILRRSGAAVTGDKAARRLRRVLVSGEIAIALVLACAAAAIAGALRHYRTVQVGYDAERVVVARPDYRALKYDHGRQLAVAEGAHARLRSGSGIADATYWRDVGQAWPPPRPEHAFQVEGRGSLPQRAQLFRYYEVGPRFFEALGAPIVEGRSFDENDARGAVPVAIVNQDAAERWWPGESAVGKRVSLNPTDPSAWLTVVGVTELVGMDPRFDRTLIAMNTRRPYLFRPFAQSGPASTPYWNWALDCYVCPQVAIGVRASGKVAAAGATLRRTLQDLEPNLPLAATPTMYEEQVQSGSGEFLASHARIISSFALVAVLLSLLGVYGVVASNVARRTRELAIRVALGASRLQLLRMILAENTSLTIVGIGAGAILYGWIQQIAGNLLFGGPSRSVRPLDPRIIVPMLILSCATIALAVIVASRSGLRRAPAEGLRGE